MNKKCRNTERVIYLRPDERDPHQEAMLLQHIETCHHCRQLHQKSQDLMTLLDTSRDQNHCSKLSTKIDLILPDQTKGAVPLSSGPTIRLIRRISGIAAAILLLLYFSQQTAVVTSINRLEKRYGEQYFKASSQLISRLALYELPHPNADKLSRLGMTPTWPLNNLFNHLKTKKP